MGPTYPANNNNDDETSPVADMASSNSQEAFAIVTTQKPKTLKLSLGLGPLNIGINLPTLRPHRTSAQTTTTGPFTPTTSQTPAEGEMVFFAFNIT